MDLGIAGRRAAVSGASSGLGLATARALAAEGVRVVIGARSADRLAEAARSIDGDVLAVPGDVGTPEGALAWGQAASQALGGVDILVPNAGGPPPGNVADTPLDAYGPALDLNLMSVVALCTSLVPPMRAAGWGRVVAITSVSVRQPLPHLVLSNTARAGATAFLKTLALEVAADGVTVNSVLPGSHETDRLRQLHGGDLSGAAGDVPVGVLGRPDDFGAVVAFLCSDQARFVTGSAIPVDGGAVRALL